MFEQICEYDGKSISMLKTLCTADVDCSGNWKLPSIMLDMQELAGVHCERVGHDFQTMRSKNVAWVLLKLEIRFMSMPKLLQKIKMTTSAGVSRRLYHYRYFETIDAETGEKLFDVVTHWTIVDLKERKALAYDVTFPGKVDEVVAPFEISRLKLKDTVFEENKIITPMYTDYDINAHVNNTRYAEWIVNELDIDKISKKYFDSVSFVYKAEIPMGEAVRLLTHKNDDYFAIRVISEDGEKTYFECEGNHGKF